ncbi:MAG: hypothetical protein FWC47_00350 [Oscillospiraceae bacterium]|nr:hypothetical protein [Oscillospiraceae bacterium]
MKIIKKLSLTLFVIVLYLTCVTQSSMALSLLNKIDVPQVLYLNSGESRNVYVKFTMMGVNSINVKSSGKEIGAKIIDAKWNIYPNMSTATINLITTSSFRGGTVTFQLISNTSFGRKEILSKTIILKYSTIE